MRLRKYLVKRTIHMVITLLIVLVLLFVLFRLMPGDAAMGLFMTPGITDIEKDQIALRYGFAKEVDYPGNHFVYNFNPTRIGHYTIDIEADSDTVQTSFDVNMDPAITDLNPPTIFDIDAIPAGNNTIALMVNATDSNEIKNIKYSVTDPEFVTNYDIIMSEVTSGHYEAIIQHTSVANNKNYSVMIEASDIYQNTATAAMTFEITVDATSGNITSIAPSFKMWNLMVGVSDGDVAANGESLPIMAQIEGATSVEMVVVTPDNTTSQPLTLTQGANWYNGSYAIPINGMFIIDVEADGIEISSSFPVNAASSSLSLPADSTILSAFTMQREVNGILVDEYPFIYDQASIPEIVVNVSAVQGGERFSDNLEGHITFPDGAVSTVYLSHPVDVVDRGMLEQFLYYMKSMLLFDFGNSFEDNRPVWDVILERVPPTLLLFGSSLILSYMIGIVVGVVVAWRRGTALELGTIVATLFLYSMPIFWSALIAQWLFFVQLEWFPLSGLGGVSMTGDKLLGMEYFVDVIWHLTLPLMTLTVLGLAGTILLMRSSMLEVMGEDFITTAKAKGLKTRQVVYRHAARNAMLPVVTSMALSLGGIISGGVLTETIFSWPGMGTLLVRGTLMHNYPIVQGAFYIMAGMTVLGNMFADILYAYLDPRVQL